ncbi:hypothetical protein GUJ93_ZPchr0004g38960 [Zizania palustris]|uniref:Uncharacterized protein n=1 Tax=Zizania palustris TaxID=103762 RepID=A0A8J5S0E9_ZIZPA|nr:hypothetical protein GUJ93_ZPchr0004g38960 [Zizania palustris]
MPVRVDAGTRVPSEMTAPVGEELSGGKHWAMAMVQQREAVMEMRLRKRKRAAFNARKSWCVEVSSGSALKFHV